MLKQWTIENFKSFGKTEIIDLAPITLLVGANSSGKSTIIQTILLIKQTLSHTDIGKSITLNGPIVRLGAFDDVKNADSTSSRIGISFYLETGIDQVKEVRSELVPSEPASFAVAYGVKFSSVSYALKFDVEKDSALPEISRLQPSLLSSTISVRLPKEDGLWDERRLSISRKTKEENVDDGLSSSSHPRRTPRLPSVLKYNVTDMDPVSREQILERKPDGEILGTLILHFMPMSFGVQFDEAKRDAITIADALCERLPSYRLGSEMMATKLPHKLVSLLVAAFPSPDPRMSFSAGAEEDRSVTVRDALERLRRIRSARRARTVRVSADGRVALEGGSQSEEEDSKIQVLYPQMRDILLASFPSRISVENVRVDQITDAAVYLRAYFGTYVKYLGPLRDEPKPIYPFEALDNPTDVGYRGEHTAAVFELNKERIVSYVPSSQFTNASPTFEAVSASLHDAVVDWLSYMGVVSDVVTGDRGKFGHELQVKTPGIEKYHDITNVGVGVSQILPIVVMALLAEKGSMLIFEQPELHLHPKVQTRLGDFFLSVVKNDRQCILETHSEYLIYRIRRRIAEELSDDIVGKSRLYFVERAGGQSNLKPVPINSFGAIMDWPEDFFDQSQDEAERILLAASRKRKLRRREENER